MNGYSVRNNYNKISLESRIDRSSLAYLKNVSVNMVSVMFPIPSYGVLPVAGGLMFLLGCVLSVAAVLAWRAKLAERHDLPFDTVFNQKEIREEMSLFQNMLGTFGAVVFVLMGGWIFIEGTSETYKFRNLPVSQIQSVKISRLGHDLSADELSRVVTMDNQGLLKPGFQTLWKCVSYSKGRKQFENGFRLELVFEDPNLKGNFLYIWRRSGSRHPTSYVSPSVGPHGMNLGEYSCSEFEQWITENVEPLFKMGTHLK